ncbi:MAG: D-2-hydroxyacid dehydrogenase [Pseudomonadota bacterium]|nr:D-2-hydroxyacid dehydrogenase [Pseudomonadota bacterium]
MPLKTFAFIHPLDESQARWFRAAMPDVEFLLPRGGAVWPEGLERAEAAAISWDSPPIDDVLAAAPALQWLHQRGAGIDRIVTARLVGGDVILTNGSGNHAPSIAEHVVGMMLAFARQLPALVRAQQERRWQPPDTSTLFELSGQTLAVVGFGAIGSTLAERAAALGMKIFGVRRSTAEGSLPPGVAAMFTKDRLDDALHDADHVVVSLPLTSETHGLFSTARLAAMKRGAYLYNVGRGALVDPAALLTALRSGQLAGAGLDVTEPEPLPADSPLWAEPNVLITAHSSGLTPRSYERYRALLLDNMQRFSRGETLVNIVDKRLGY